MKLFGEKAHTFLLPAANLTASAFGLGFSLSRRLHASEDSQKREEFFLFAYGILFLLSVISLLFRGLRSSGEE